MKTQWLKLTGLFLIAALVALVVGSGFALNQNNNTTVASNSSPTPVSESKPVFLDIAQLPDELTPCLRNRSVSQYLLWGESGNYQLISLQEDNQWWDTIAAIKETSCQLLIPKEESLLKALSAYVPEAVALDLARQRYKKAIELAGGLEAFRSDFIAHASDPTTDVYLPAEYVQALEELGIQVPDNLIVVGVEGVNQE
ncbi:MULTISPECIES: hypothetical protein [unclassified Coleofasciculus]|uniref:hypothetical protein n=1 Tax=unclassified Coleofasciculus TaxID=2692782 RepID=UPI00187E98CD|nr:MULTISPECIES: hypothetical protein [unclassified Coleofasciculus]MBE9124755.1 hypothetical protein [Coleofasciculus sp. LEGE 07081]MBE9148207.1 hypothetical protein [Coleofasciculus sp. LEGE 07092]